MSVSSCPRCGREKSPDHFACARCWWLLPDVIRRGIWRAYRRDGVVSEGYEAAAASAEEYWLHHHPLEDQPPEPLPGQLSLEDSR